MKYNRKVRATRNKDRVKITTFVLFPQMPKWQINFSFKTHRNSTEKTVT